MKKLTMMLVTMLAAIALSVSVFAAGGCTGKVTKVEGDKVTVTLATAPRRGQPFRLWAGPPRCCR